MVSASSDATVRVWDAKSCDCLVTFRPPQSSAGAEASISSVHFNPQNLEQLVVCPRASTIYVMTMQVILRWRGRGAALFPSAQQLQGSASFAAFVSHILMPCMLLARIAQAKQNGSLLFGAVLRHSMVCFRLRVSTSCSQEGFRLLECIAFPHAGSGGALVPVREADRG